MLSTLTTSADSTTITTTTIRTITTLTSTETATTTVGDRVRARAPNAAAVAEDIIQSVISSGTDEPTPTPKNWQRLQAEEGLANACSCKNVDPTETVTSSFTLPPEVCSMQ